ncbi:DEAD/DEAH box helicase family protein [Clostridiisalibacter paucivorans]|uniref:DEAD/DEAH box helicase family protein n=1 Tax=Clostridiisalibacter paucivorans TaxID=408753 RepID=UPI00047BF259|nr:DEAD/DEAH box helicase family protein [Clostridiisalibacter paucivorans]
MVSNFEYLKKEKKYNKFVDACIEAERLMNVSYSATATFARRALELAVKWVYANDGELKVPYQDNLASLIYNYEFKSLVEPEMIDLLSYIHKLGNKAVHTTMAVRREEAVLSLRNLFAFTSWIDYCYSEEFEEREFNENLLGDNNRFKKTVQEKDELFEILSQKDRRLEEVVQENKKLRSQNESKRRENQRNRNYKVDEISEFETRKMYINLNLELNGWEIGRDCLEEVEVKNMDNSSGIGFVDYVLYGNDGNPLALVEAKKTSVSPRIGKVQAKMYAEALEAETGVRPIIFYTNGIDYYIWDDTDYPERKLSGIYSKKDLESLNFKKKNKESLKNLDIRDEITNRPYQKEAITRVLEAYETGHRKALLVMATGSGKTRTAASIVDILTRRNWVKNILFLADRTALVKQAKQSFNEHLQNLSLCNLLNNKDDINSRMIFSTYPTMMNAIDEVRNKDGKKMFTNGHFDLIIVDESHRSIYKKYQDIFDYFDANLLGLTATPVDEIDRNTYRVFELEDNNPTFAYELEQAIEDGYLVDYGQPKVYDLKLMKDGIKYSELSEEEKEQFEMTFDDFEDISSEELNRSLFNKDTVDIVIQELMEKGIKVEGGDKLGKTIIFAANQRHADFIVERFDALYPEYKGHFAQAVYHNINYVDNVIDSFKDKDSYPQIAVSVDMLDTGIDVPELVNLVFFKKVRSKAKFWQMIGRGTRLCEGLFGPGIDKEKFLIFDYYKNFEFFEINKKGKENNIQRSLTENIFNIKVDIIKALEHLDYQEPDLIEHRNRLIDNILEDISNINRQRFNANMRIHLIDKYSNKETFKTLSEKDVLTLKEEISPLIISIDEDELAKRFDYLMYTIEFAYLEKRPMNRPKSRVVSTAEKLETKGTISQIRDNEEIIDKIQTEEFWEEANLFDYELVRKALRDLIKLIDKENRKIYYTDFKDEIVEVKEGEAIYNVNDLGNYRKRVEHYLKEYEDNLPIYKLKNNEELTQSDIEYFEKILWQEIGSKEEYQQTYGDQQLLKLVASITGMERQAAEKEFSKFLNDENLNSDQIDFVNSIVDYIVKNGSIEREVLQEYPFNKKGGVVNLFKDRIDVVKDIVSVIDRVNDRLSV